MISIIKERLKKLSVGRSGLNLRIDTPVEFQKYRKAAGATEHSWGSKNPQEKN